MANIIEKIVKEDLELGRGTVSITNPAGGSLLGSKIGIHTFWGDGHLNPSDFSGADLGAKIVAAIAAFPSTGGVVDAGGFTGNHTAASTIVIDKPVILLLGGINLTGPTSGPVIRVDSTKVIIQGIGRGDFGDAVGTIILPQASAQSHGIHFTTTGDGHRYGSVRDLNIENTGAGRTGGRGIFVDAGASPASNSISNIERVTVRGMYDGLYLNRPITTLISQVRSENSVNDGFVLQGDGTSTSLINCYANASGRYGYLQRGVGYVAYINTAADASVSHNYRIERESGTTGALASALSFISIGSEGAGGDGVSILDGTSIFFTGGLIDSPVGDGIDLSGARNVVIDSMVFDQVAGYDINITDSGLLTASAIYGRAIESGTPTLGFLSDPVNAYFEMGRRLDANFKPNVPIVMGDRDITGVDDLSADGITTVADQSKYLGLGRYSGAYLYALINSETAGAGLALRTGGSDRVLIENDGTINLGISGTRVTIDTLGNIIPFATARTLGNSTKQWRVYNQVIATGSLPAAGASLDGVLIIEDAGAGDRNLIIYAGAQRFRIDGGSAF